MVRVKKAKHAIKRRRKTLKKTKGYRHGRKSKEREAKQAWIRAGQHAFAHRKQKKREFRKLWQIKINAAARAHGMSYSTFMNGLKKKNVALDRKTLASIAENEPETFERVVKHVS